MPKPRNRTALAYDARIANPPSAHPKDGVGNTAPGLELDERGIEKYIFPGIVIEFQAQVQTKTFPDLPIVRSIDHKEVKSLRVTPNDSRIIIYSLEKESDYLFVYAFRTFGQGSRQVFRFYDFDKARAGTPRLLACWDAIRNAEYRAGDKIALLIGVRDLKERPAWKGAIEAFDSIEAFDKPKDPRIPPSSRTAGGRLIWAIVTGKRAPLVNPEGLAFPKVPPGELQSTMCTPWHYDFRDCHCYYWAANRPDMVSGDGPDEHNQHYLRKRKPVWEGTPIPPEVWAANPSHPAGVAKQRKVLWTHVDIINKWEQLPVVQDDRASLSSFHKVVERLQILASVEHAIAVEYLHAFHSIDPKFSFKGAPLGAQARAVIRQIAVDEMRHFRWVNEILRLLEPDPLNPVTVIDRATNYGPNFDWRAFALNPLTQDNLDWFIRIEKPTRTSRRGAEDERLEGLYINVWRMITEEGNKDEVKSGRVPNRFGSEATIDKIQSLIKLIIDEGDGHYRKLADLKRRLFGYADGVDHLRKTDAGPKPAEVSLSLEISDFCYQVMLIKLGRMFARGDEEDGARLEQLVDHMLRLESLNESLADSGYQAKFAMPIVDASDSGWNVWFETLRGKIRELTKKLDDARFDDGLLKQAAEIALDGAARMLPGQMIPNLDPPAT